MRKARIFHDDQVLRSFYGSLLQEVPFKRRTKVVEWSIEPFK